MDREKQFETMALLRAYALPIALSSPDDLRPSTANEYAKCIERMVLLAKSLDTKS